MTLPAFYAPEQEGHDPQSFLVLGQFRAAEEVPERARRLKAGAEAAGLSFQRPQDAGQAPLAAVHTPEYLHFLSHIHRSWSEIPGAAPEVIPNLHLDRTLGGYPKSPVGLANYHQADAACPIGQGTWEAACWSAWTAVAATDAVLNGAPAAYALSRPPGHHAYADLAGGFCFLNNSAIAAQRLRSRHNRVAVLDVDVHHGNGTQGIFYNRRDVLTISLHADPREYYPFMVGYAHERGAGDGLGFNLNVPLPRSTKDASYLLALDHALGVLQAFHPDALVLALGLDAYEGDPLQGMQLSTGCFQAIGSAVAGLGLPTVVVQEGGYVCDGLGENLTSLLGGFIGGASQG
ncbi:MAG: histone deacetylase family protein [Paracoccaceae bacterium]